MPTSTITDRPTGFGSAAVRHSGGIYRDAFSISWQGNGTGDNILDRNGRPTGEPVQVSRGSGVKSTDVPAGDDRSAKKRRIDPTNQVVLITGGTAGIGLAMADAFIERGSKVVVCGRSDEALERFSRSRPSAMAIKADVTVEQDRAAMLDLIAERHGRLDVLINNAGTFVERDFAGGLDAMDGLEQEVALNLTAPIRLTGEVLARWPTPHALIFVTSGFALVSPARAPTYGAVKFGLHGFAEGLRRQLESGSTHVLELLPPMTDTPMNAGQKGRKMSPAAVAANMMRALDRRRTMALPGVVRILPTLLRLAPKTFGRMVSAV